MRKIDFWSFKNELQINIPMSRYEISVYGKTRYFS